MHLDSFLDQSITIGHSYITAEGNIVGPMISATNLIFSQDSSSADKDLISTLYIEEKHKGYDASTRWVAAWNAEGRPYVVSHGFASSHQNYDLQIILDLNNTSNVVLAQLLIKTTLMLTQHNDTLERLEQQIEKLTK